MKIGYSNDVHQRHRQLEMKYGCELVILSVIPGNKEREREIHEKFAHLRFRRTEQFAPAAELFRFIGRPLLSPKNFECVEPMSDAIGYKNIILTLRGSLAFKGYLEEAAKLNRTSVAKFLEHAIVFYVREMGYKDEIPER